MVFRKGETGCEVACEGGLAADSRLAVADLTQAALALRPLAEAGHSVHTVLEGPWPLPPDVVDVTAAVLAAVGPARPAVGLPPATTGVPEPGEAMLARIVTDWLQPRLTAPALARVPRMFEDEVGRIVAEEVAGTFETWRSPVDAIAPDGAQLHTYAAGERGSPAVVIASACGMPARLCETWMRSLASDHFVVTWETRGLFGGLSSAAAFDRLEHDVAAQAGDLLAVMDRYEVAAAHVMGICGGAVVALRAAAEQPGRVSSLSLWHGDYELGPDCPKTEHQHNLEAVMAMAAHSRQDAAVIHAALCGTAMAAVPDDVAHLVVYPYASAELFYRYCVLTGAIMRADVGSLLGAVRQPSLVVTSDDDHTAHPAGSHRVAARLADSVLHVEEQGDHISVFRAGGRLRRMMTTFLTGLAEREPWPPVGAPST